MNALLKLSLLSATLFLVELTSAQCLFTIGTADAISPIPVMTPIHNTFANGKVQYLYHANELIAAGCTAGDIDRLDIEFIDQDTSTTNIYITMGHSSKGSLDSLETSLLNIGFNGSYFAQTLGGMQTFSLTTPFFWDGASNLVVEFSFTNLGSTGIAPRVAVDTGLTFLGARYAHHNGLVYGWALTDSYPPNALRGSLNYRPIIHWNGDIITSVQTLDLGKELDMFPNPTQGILSFTFPVHATQYELRNAQGILLRTGARVSGVVSLDIHDLPSGIYFLRFFDRHGVSRAISKIVRSN